MAKSPWRRLISVKAEPVFALAPDRPLDFLEALVGLQRWSSSRLQRTRRPAASACPIWLRSTSRASRICATSGSSADGSACTRLPPAVPRLRVCTWPTNASACRSSGTLAASAVVALDVALPRAGAHAHGVRFGRDEFQRRDLVDVDQPGRAQQPERHHGDQALPAGDDLGRRRRAATAARRPRRSRPRGHIQTGAISTCDLKTLPARYQAGRAAVPYSTNRKITRPPCGAQRALFNITPARKTPQGGVMRRSWMWVVAIAACIAHGEALAQLVADQAGDGHRAVHGRQRDRHHGAHGGAAAVGTARPALRGREPARRGRHDRGRRGRAGRAGRPHDPGAFVVLHHHADDLSRPRPTTRCAISSASRRWRCCRTCW